MCNLYRLGGGVAAIRALFRAAGGPDPPLSGIARLFPQSLAPVVAERAGGRVLAAMRWGMPGPPAAGRRPVTNVRNLESPFWRPLLGKAHRVLVPASAFCEWSAAPDPATGRKREHWFALCDAPLFAFAGLFRPGPPGEPPRFAILTCPPNALVAAVHPKAMPVILEGAAAESWLAGTDARAFQQPFPAARMLELTAG